MALSGSAQPAHVALTERLFLDCSTDVRSGFGVTLTAVELEADAPALRVPTVVVAGERDRLIPARFSRRLVELLPDAQLLVLPEAGHQTPLERAADVTACIRGAAAAAAGDVIVLPEPQKA